MDPQVWRHDSKVHCQGQIKTQMCSIAPGTGTTVILKNRTKQALKCMEAEVACGEFFQSDM